MKKILTLIVFIHSFFSFAQDWTQHQDYPLTERDDGVSFTIDEKAYCGTGLDIGFNPTSNFQVFDLNSETWQNIQGLPNGKERQYATATSFNGKGYVFGGSNNTNSLNDLWRYNPNSNSWEELSNLPGIGRGGCTNFILNNQWYIIGGKVESGTITNEIWAYNFLTENWTQKSNIPNTGTWRGIAFSNSTTGFIGLGLDSFGNLNTQFWEYEPLSNSWTINTNFAITERTYPSYSQIGDTVFVYGGLSSTGDLLNTFERIEITTQTVTQLNSLSSFPRKGCMAFCSQNEFYLTTGVTLTNRVKETWKASYILGQNENTITNELTIYYDKKYLYVKLKNQPKSVNLYTLTGKRIANEKFSLILPLENINSGVYFYTVETTEKTYRGKIYIRQ